MTSVSRLVLFLLVLALPVGWAQAQDQQAEMRTVARDLASQGADSFEHQDYAAALDRFNRAYALVPAPSISIMQARSLERLGRLVEALDKYETTQHAQLSPDAPDAFKQAIQDARREAESLWARVPRLRIHILVPSAAPKRLDVTIDGRQVPAALIDVERPIDPGTHQISVNAEGFPPTARAISIESGDRITLQIPLYPSIAAATSSDEAPSPTVAATTMQSPTSTSSGIWGWVALSAAAVGYGTSAITGVIALEKKSALDAQCHPGCPGSAADDISTFRTMRTLSYATLGMGTVALGVGGYLLIHESSREQRRLGLALHPSQALVWGTF